MDDASPFFFILAYNPLWCVQFWSNALLVTWLLALASVPILSVFLPLFSLVTKLSGESISDRSIACDSLGNMVALCCQSYQSFQNFVLVVFWSYFLWSHFFFWCWQTSVVCPFMIVYDVGDLTFGFSICSHFDWSLTFFFLWLQNSLACPFLIEFVAGGEPLFQLVLHCVLWLFHVIE